jgi:hypothetical protein
MAWMNRIVPGVALFATISALGAARAPAGIATEITVYRPASCGCCKKWEDYLRANGFVVKDVVQDDLTSVKAELGVTNQLRSCHTAVVQGYVIEGHVPVGDIQRLLKEHPKLVGLAAPGMPPSSPGMDMGRTPYDVLSFDAKGNTGVWAHH